MALPLGAKCLKCLLFVFNLLFVVSGIILIAVGSVIKTPYSAYHYILDHGFFAIPVLLIFIGIIIFIVSFFGCCGAFKENYCMTITFGVCLVVIFILEISGGIAGYVLKEKVSEALKEDLVNSMKNYSDSKDVRQMWDLAQSNVSFQKPDVADFELLRISSFVVFNFHCCGALNKYDWNISLPKSCCPGDVQCPINSAYNTSCYEILENLFTSNAGTLGGAGIGIAVIQILGILFSYSLATSIGKQYETLEKD